MYLKDSKIIVIKIGSSLLIDDKKKVRKKWLTEFAKDIQELIKQNKKSYYCKLRCNSNGLQKTKY